MTGPRHRHAAPPMALALTLAFASACIPQPAGRASPSPDASAGPVVRPTPSAAPSGPSPSPSFVRPTPNASPTFMSYVVKAGDTLTSIAKAHGTTARSLAFWNRTRYPSLDPDSPSYSPNRIEIGWVLLLVPDNEIDEDETFPE